MSDWSSDVCSADLITLIAIGADVAQCYRGGRPGRNLGHRPKHLVETLLAAVERIGAVVDGHLIRLAVERELALGDAVGEPPHRAADILGLVEILLEIVVAERDRKRGGEGKSV